VSVGGLNLWEGMETSLERVNKTGQKEGARAMPKGWAQMVPKHGGPRGTWIKGGGEGLERYHGEKNPGLLL